LIIILYGFVSILPPGLSAFWIQSLPVKVC